MNDHCLLKIFEHLDASSLYSVAQANTRLQWLATDVYRRKFGSKEHRIIKQTRKPKKYIYNRFGRIEIDEFKVISQLCNQFGHVISKVSIHTSGNSKSIKKNLKNIVKVINDSSMGLKELTLSCQESKYFLSRLIISKDNPLEYVSKSFNHVENLNIDGDYKTLRSKTLAFHEIFPNLKRLYMKDVEIEYQESIAVAFRHLEHLKVNPVEDESIKILIEMNPQIRKLSISPISMNFLHFLSINLKNLAYLNLNLKSYQQPDYASNIYFEMIQHLTISSDRSDFARHVHFHQLQELNLLVKNRNILSQNWIEFIERNNNLKKLHIEWIITDNMFKSLTAIVPHLIESYFYLMLRIDTNTIINFFKNNPQLKRLKIIFRKEYPDRIQDVYSLQLRIEKNWTFSETDFGCLIERR